MKVIYSVIGFAIFCTLMSYAILAFKEKVPALGSFLTGVAIFILISFMSI